MALRGPYMHDGRERTLESVIRYYARGASKDPGQDAGLAPFEISDTEVADLVAFMHSLTGQERPGLPERSWSLRVRQTSLRFVDADGRPLAGLNVRLRPVSDPAALRMDAADLVTGYRTDDAGWIQFVPAARIHTRVELDDELEPLGGSLIPDTCSRAELVIPIRGRAAVVLVLRGEHAAPSQLVAEHPGVFVLPGHAPPRTRLTRSHVVGSGANAVVRYEGWFRADVPTEVTLRLPGLAPAPAHVNLDPLQVACVDLSTR